MELIKIVRGIGSFVLALFIVAIPSICTVSYALDWNTDTKYALTIMTIVLIFVITLLIYTESDE